MQKFIKIYKLKTPDIDNLYIGSTIESTLSIRLSKHKFNAKTKQANLYKFLNCIGWDAVEIELIDTLPYIDKEDKLYLEKHYIDTYQPLLNMRRPIII